MIAIDALVGRCITFLQRANGANATLRQNFPEGYSLDPSHVPHLTLWQHPIDNSNPAELHKVKKHVSMSDRSTTAI